MERYTTQYPFVDQFNATYAVVLIDDKKYYLDAMDPYGQPEMVPFSILNTRFHCQPQERRHRFHYGRLEAVQGKHYRFPEDWRQPGNIRRCYLNSSEYARIDRLRSWKRNRDRYLNGFRKAGVSLTIDSVETKNEDQDSLPFYQHIRFKAQATATGDYIFIPINLFSGFETNPFLAANRFSDMNFGFKQNISFSTYIDVPEGYVSDALPKSLQLVNADKTVIFIRELFDDAQQKGFGADQDRI